MTLGVLAKLMSTSYRVQEHIKHSWNESRSDFSHTSVLYHMCLPERLEKHCQVFFFCGLGYNGDTQWSIRIRMTNVLWFALSAGNAGVFVRNAWRSEKLLPTCNYQKIFGEYAKWFFPLLSPGIPVNTFPFLHSRRSKIIHLVEWIWDVFCFHNTPKF